MDENDKRVLSGVDSVFLSRLFSDSSDRDSHAWLLEDVTFDRLAKLPFRVGSGTTQVYIFNQFRNRQPHVYNYDYFHLGKNNVKFHASVICDSNIASLLHKRVTEPDALTLELYGAAQQLLQTFLLNDLDYNSFFYLLEAAAKVTLADYQGIARGIEESFLLLHSMDHEHFLASGEISPSISRRRLYQDEFDAIAFSDIVKTRFERVSHGTTIPQCDYLYAGLLQAIYIHKGPDRRKSITTKLKLFRSFLTDDLGVVSAHLMLLVPEYFAGLADDFITFQTNTPFESQRTRILATTWDLFLLTLPAMLLSSGDQDGATLAMICSADRAFHRIGSKFSLETIFCQRDQPLRPGYSYDYAALEQQQGAEFIEKLETMAQTFGLDRLKRHKLVPSFVKNVGPIISDLERRLSTLCKGQTLRES